MSQSLPTEPYAPRPIPKQGKDLATMLANWLSVELQNIKRAIPNYGHTVVFGDAPPTTGTWGRGDIIFDNTPTAGSFIGWTCVTAGTPGTWKTWGAISP